MSDIGNTIVALVWQVPGQRSSSPEQKPADPELPTLTQLEREFEEPADPEVDRVEQLPTLTQLEREFEVRTSN